VPCSCLLATLMTYPPGLVSALPFLIVLAATDGEVLSDPGMAASTASAWMILGG